jgi:Domain of unknown function (DUF1918)
MKARETLSDARAGDRLEERARRGEQPRCGEILEVLGTPGHERYRVRWKDDHESIVYPDDGVSVIPAHAHARDRR